MGTRKTRWSVAAAVLGAAVGLLVVASWGGTDNASPKPAAVPTSAQLAASRVAQCRADLIAVHDLWMRDPSFRYDPPSCDQPGVSGTDYVRLFAEVGGGKPVWVAP